VDENEPDVRARSPATDASAPIEIKVAEAWTLKDLEDALSKQLCGRYLRAQEGKHGILLLVHQKPRPKGWRNARTGKSLKFEEVVAHLCAIAVKISSKSPDDAQPVVAAIDVTSRHRAPRRAEKALKRRQHGVASKKPKVERINKRSKSRKRR
jgi:hypothetical protein